MKLALFLIPALIAAQPADLSAAFQERGDLADSSRVRAEIAAIDAAAALNQLFADNLHGRGGAEIAALVAAQAADRNHQLADGHPGKLSAEIAAKLSEKLGQSPNKQSMHQGSAYSRGSAALHRGEWEKAAQSFEQASKQKGARTDGALYWRAWAFHKLGRKDESLAVLATLAKDHPQSRWAADAKALEVEVRQSSGQPVSPEEFSNEEIKLYALNGLANTDPERALPMLNKILTGAASPRIRERALFVLAQIRTPQARETLTRIAKGQDANPDMQLWAVRYIGHSRDKEALPVLAEIYASTTDSAIKRQVLDAYASQKDKARLVEVAQSEKDADLRRSAVERIGQLNDAKPLIDMARAEKDPKFKKEIVRVLSQMKSKEAADYLLEVLSQ